MPTTSAGIMIYRLRNDRAEVLLVHPGGPFFQKKDEGAWSIPKGIPEEGEKWPEAARRELEEETGIKIKSALQPLGSVKQKGGKTVHAWAAEGDLPEGFTLKSNFFELEWPPRSGKKQPFPEIDRAEFIPLETARAKINPAQVPFIDRLEEIIKKQ